MYRTGQFRISSTPGLRPGRTPERLASTSASPGDARDTAYGLRRGENPRDMGLAGRVDARGEARVEWVVGDRRSSLASEGGMLAARAAPAYNANRRNPRFSGVRRQPATSSACVEADVNRR